MPFPGFDQFWNEAVVRAGLDKQAGDYYGRILQYYMEEQGNVGPAITPYTARGETTWKVSDHFGNFKYYTDKEQAEREYQKVETDWEDNSYLGRAHREMEEDIETADLDITNALKQYQTSLAGIGGKEASEKAAHDALMKDYLRQREQETSEFALEKAMTTSEWDDWQAEEQIDWRDRRKQMFSDLARTGGRGGRAAGVFGEASRDRFGSIGRRETRYGQEIEQAELGYQGEIGAIASREELQNIAYQRALKDYQQQRAEAGLRKDISTGQAGLTKKGAQSLYKWELGRTGIEQRQKQRDLAAQRAEFVDKGVAASQASALAQYVSARQPYEQITTGT
jgi:hypothetical protein